MMNKVLGLALGIALVALSSAPALATKPAPEHKVVICHATPPDTAANGWHSIDVDVASVGYQQSGHQDQHDADIIPPYQYDEFIFLGKNWDTAGQAIWNNGCETPPTGGPEEPEPPEKPQNPDVPVILPPNQPITPEQPRLFEVFQQPITTPAVYAPRASFLGPCGDPRVKAVFDNSASTVPVRFKWILTHAKDGARIVRYRIVQPGEVFTTKWNWLRGRGVLTRVRGQYQELLAIMSVYAGDPWGTNGCVK